MRNNFGGLQIRLFYAGGLQILLFHRLFLVYDFPMSAFVWTDAADDALLLEMTKMLLHISRSDAHFF